MSDGGERPPDDRAARSARELAGLGIEIALPVVLFMFAGRWLDGRLGTLPWLTIAGAFVGAAGGFLSLYRGITAAAADEESGPR